MFRHLVLVVLAAALVAASPPAPAAPAAVVGPPTVCHPIDIGDATSLPWGSAAFGTDAGYDVARTVDDTLAILRGSSDTLVHMETLRRAVIYLTPLSEAGAARPAAWREQEIGRLLAGLQADLAACSPGKGDPAVKDAAAKDAPAKTRMALPSSALATPVLAGGGDHCQSPEALMGLREFDIGYVLAALFQSERHGSDESRAELSRQSREWLAKAAGHRPDDGALRLGAALATYDGSDSQTCYAHLERAVALSTDPDGLLRRNLMKTMGAFLGAKTYDDLAAKVSALRERA